MIVVLASHPLTSKNGRMSPSSDKTYIPSKNVSRETFLHLEQYAALLLKWNQKINLIGKTTENELWARHIEDSLQLLPLIPSSTKTLADFGSGAGLPGIIIAIARPDISVTLVEQDQRKSAFLIEAARALNLSNVTVMACDIHNVDVGFDIVCARALAPLSELCALAYPRLGKNAICLFPKGENFATELAEAGDKWQFKHHEIPSKTNEKSCIVSLSELSPKGSVKQ